MTRPRFLVVATGRDCFDRVEPCLTSIARQRAPMSVCVVDDASSDKRQPALIEAFASSHGWVSILNDTRRYGTESQLLAWSALEPRDDDVVLFVDLDDRLAHQNVGHVLRTYYGRGALMTYGSYVAVPETHPSARTCRPARPYPSLVSATRTYRQSSAYFNHLRTISWRVLKHVSDDDLRSSSGNYWRAITDLAVMVPCLEMAGPRRTAVVREVLYEYTCDGSDAVWRTASDVLRAEGAELRGRDRKPRLW